MWKKIFVIGSLMLIGGLLVLAGLIFVLSEVSNNYVQLETKALIKDYLRAGKNFIYYEATIHNPAGDMLPDEIDNTIIKEIKTVI